jgi:6,7-dimethyl-8-ribityllumazine synthase
MLKEISTSANAQAKGQHFAIIASKYNTRFVEGMLNPAVTALEKAGAKTIRVVRVPGAFEIPAVAATLAETKKYAVLICLGVIIRGETAHAQHIGEAVSHALAEVQLRWKVPVIHEVLLLENEAQAEARCLNPKHNRGLEAAQTAIEMAGIMRQLGK